MMNQVTLPAFKDPSGPEFTFQAPFRFSDVRVSVFPLRARQQKLQLLVDSSLNQVPPHVAHFRVSAPVVLMMLLDYGALAANEQTNFGAFAQRELVFLIPLEQYRQHGHGWVFDGLASFAPFIYVDDSFSMHLGRTVMGWRKALISFDPQETGWLRDPNGRISDLTVSAQVCPRVYRAMPFEEQPIIVVQSQQLSPFSTPPNLTSPYMPWNVWMNAMRGVSDGLSMWAEAVQGGMQQPGPLSAHPGERLQQVLRAFGLGGGAAGTSGLSLSSINLKQFRKTSDPELVCFQALTSGPVKYGSVSGGGMLGNPLIDPSGGYRVGFQCFPTFPVVKQLGLEVEGNDPSLEFNRVYARPLYPFWYQADINYGSTRTMAYRTSHGAWRSPSGETLSNGQTSGNVYASYNGLGSPVVTGPFVFESSVLRVFPVRADPTKVQKLLDETFNDPLSGLERFTTTPTDERGEVIVYVALIDWGKVTSHTNDLGNWSDTSVSFIVPIERHSGTPDKPETSRGILSAYTLTSGQIHSSTWTELYGIPSVKAQFNAGRNADLSARNLVRINARTLPALYEGQLEEYRPLLDINLPNGASRAPFSSKDQTVLAYTLKQFRDSQRFDRACYQALVQVPFELTNISEAFVESAGAQLVLHEAPMIPIVERLGLDGRSVIGTDGPVTVIETEPWHGIRGDILMANGTELYERTDSVWKTSLQ